MSVWTASQHADFGRADLYANPVKPARVGLVVVAAFILFLGIWGAVAPISGAACCQVSTVRLALEQSTRSGP